MGDDAKSVKGSVGKVDAKSNKSKSPSKNDALDGKSNKSKSPTKNAELNKSQKSGSQSPKKSNTVLAGQDKEGVA